LTLILKKITKKDKNLGDMTQEICVQYNTYVFEFKITHKCSKVLLFAHFFMVEYHYAADLSHALWQDLACE
jgi:hypothetical protein